MWERLSGCYKCPKCTASVLTFGPPPHYYDRMAHDAGCPGPKLYVDKLRMDNKRQKPTMRCEHDVEEHWNAALEAAADAIRQHYDMSSYLTYSESLGTIRDLKNSPRKVEVEWRGTDKQLSDLINLAIHECQKCSAIPGSPTLCDDCLERRTVAGEMWKGPR